MKNKLESILNSYINNENRNSGYLNYTPDNIRAFLKLIGNPQNNFKSIHIAGTNGKGTTANLLHDFLFSSNFKTGLFTSPHLIHITERIKISGKYITENELYEIIKKIDKTSKQHNLYLTYFDLLTAASFIYFENEKVDFAIIECGLGGKLDSTNVINPILSAITQISLDHQTILGDNILDITLEKSGIIKNNIPVITNNSDDEIVKIIKKQSSIKNSKYINSNINIKNISKNKESFSFNFYSNNFNLEHIETGIIPKTSIYNIALSLEILCQLKVENINHNKLKKIIKQFRLQGRFEISNNFPFMIFDSAHNYNSIQSLCNTASSFYSDKKITVFCSFMNDKNPKQLLNYISNNLTNEIIYITLDDKRAYIPNDQNLVVINFNDAINCLKKYINTDNINIFTGSFRLYKIFTDILEKL